MALNLEADNVGVVIFGEDRGIKEGDTVKRTGAIVEVPVGKVCSAAWSTRSAIRSTARDQGGQSHAGRRQGARHPAEEVGARADGDRLKAIDALIPIGRGQRELIIGDRQTGKTAVILDTFLNQKPLNASGDGRSHCVYVAVGQKRSTVAQFVKVLEENGAPSIRSSSPPPPPTLRRCSTWRRSPAAPWASISATTACMR